MTSVTPNQTSSQYEVTESEDKIQSLVEEVKPESEIDLEFLYTRDIEFRQETIYFIVVDRFYDGDPQITKAPTQNFTIQKAKIGENIGAAICRELSTNSTT